MIYKMYKMIFREEPELPQDLNYFEKLYDENGVEVVGEWINMDNPKEMYFITGYKDEDHYKKFTEIAQKDDKYQEISKTLNEIRESIEVVNLKETNV